MHKSDKGLRADYPVLHMKLCSFLRKSETFLFSSLIGVLNPYTHIKICTKCSDLKRCIKYSDLKICIKCSDLKRCIKCSDLKICIKCSDLKICIKCSNLKICIKCSDLKRCTNGSVSYLIYCKAPLLHLK